MPSRSTKTPRRRPPAKPVAARKGKHAGARTPNGDLGKSAERYALALEINQ